MIVQELPIYNDIREYVTAYIRVFEKMKKLHKYHIGKDMYEKSLSLFEFIETANKAKGANEKVQIYEEMGTIIDGILIRLRIADDAGAISHRHHARLSAKLVKINKQVSGLKNRFSYGAR